MALTGDAAFLGDFSFPQLLRLALRLMPELMPRCLGDDASRHIEPESAVLPLSRESGNPQHYAILV